MTWPVSANPDRFDSAMEWFENRVPIPANELKKLSKEAQKQAFVIAGVNQMSVVMTIFSEMEKAVESNEPIGEFRKRVKAQLKGQWTKAASARLDTIFITSTQTAYNSGRHRQLTKPEVMKTRPFWLFDAVLDSRTTHICQTLNGLTLPADSPAWTGSYPPMHHRCRSGIRTQRRSVVERRGGPTKEGDIPSPKVPKGFGKVPAQAQFKPSKKDFPADVWAVYQKKQKELRSSK
ncbi:MAG: minor capsid protein [Halieaceae bacterium]|nr:minor capsid protein [Halieaceae bacterium]